MLDQQLKLGGKIWINIKEIKVKVTNFKIVWTI